METWTGLYVGDGPMRAYLCLVCARFWQGYCDPGNEIEFDGDMLGWDLDYYIKTEAKLAPYVIQAGVTPVAVSVLKHGG